MSRVEYELRSTTVSPDKLLLDPNNPRLQKRAGSPRLYSEREIEDPNLQAQTLNALVRGEHEVERLAESIRTNGFVPIDSIFVKYLPTIDKYLVIEGNRRTAAVKTIRQNPKQVSPDVLSALSNLPVKELICDDADFASHMTEFILSIRHIYGVKEWAPMQRAHSVYTSYLHRFETEVGKQPFRFVSTVAAAVGTTMNLTPAEVQKAIAIYSLYKQMQDEGYEVRADHYSLIEMAVARPKMAADLFEFDKLACRFSRGGMELFSDLCVEEDCPINNPRQYRELYGIWRDGNAAHIRAVATGSETLENVARQVLERADSKDAEAKLDRAKSVLERISIDQIRGSRREAELAISIKKLIDEKLIPAIENEA